MKMPKLLDRILTVIGYAISIAPFILLGIYSARSIDVLFPEENTGAELLTLGGLILLGVVFILIHTIIHEGGHFLCGLMNGWKFVSFRIGSLTLAKQDGKLHFKKTTVVGTGGQCLMSPPICKPSECPFFLYLLGGGAANILTGEIALLIGSFTTGLPSIILSIFAIVGFGLGVMNLFPAKMGGTMNDGYQIFIELPKNPKAKTAQYLLLAANAILTESESTDDLPEEVKNEIMDFSYDNLGDTSTANLLLYKAAILSEKGCYEEIREIYQRISDSDNVLDLFRKEARCELLYLEIMGDCDPERIERLADKKQLEYIKLTALYPSRKRLMYAYYLVYKRDEALAEKEYEALLKTAETHPVKAEGAIELKEAERVKKRYDETRNTQEAL